MPGYLSALTVRQQFQCRGNIGGGSDGLVDLYQNRHFAGEIIAVKYPRDGSEYQTKEIFKEIETLRRIRHENVVSLLGWDDSWAPHAPAVFLEVCPLGDVFRYRLELTSRLGRVPEETLWKLFVDMSLALDHLHNGCQPPFVHGDFKPDNIFVQFPRGWAHSQNQVCVLPTFKLADFSRTIQYLPGSGRFDEYMGTWCYAPPPEERRATVTPASDVFSLGATLQFLASGKDPNMRNDAFRELLMAKGYKPGDIPPDAVLSKAPREWTRHWPVVYRPLSAFGQAPYSKELNKWYAMCLHKDMARRITARELRKWLVPLAIRQVDLLVKSSKARYLKTLSEAIKARNMLARLSPRTRAPVS